MRFLENSHSQRQKVEWGKERMGESVFMDTKFQFYKMKTDLEMHDGDGCTL